MLHFGNNLNKDLFFKQFILSHFLTVDGNK